MSRRRLVRLGGPAIAAAAMLLLVATASSYTPTATSTWVVSGGSGGGGGIVASTAVSGSIAYLGGNFSYVGPPTGSFAAFEPGTGDLSTAWPAVAGNVYAAVPDGDNGFFIGGSFRSVGTRHADNIAHIKSDGAFDTNWTGSTDGTVYALAVSSNTVYAGGDFDNAGGGARVNLAGFSKTTGALAGSFASSATGADSFVAALRLSGSTLYVGGKFTSLGGFSRTNLGAVSATTGTAVPGFTSNADGIVYALAVGGGILYAGGAFSHINTSSTREFLAAIDSAGVVQPWDPSPSGEVYALEVSGSFVYAGGAFQIIDDVPRKGIAKLNAAGTGAAVAGWDPQVFGDVFQISAPGAGETVYVGGSFENVDGAERDNVVAFDASTGIATAFAPVVGGEVDALAVSGNRIGFGGEFRTAGPVAGPTTPLHRSNLAAIDLSSGVATDWNPGANNTVEVLLVSGSVIYAGGGFTVANGQPRERLAAFTTGGAATSWNPGIHNGTVLALTVVGDTVYAGGTFSGPTSVSVPPVQRNRVAAFLANGVGNGFGDLTAWNPNANGTVFALDWMGSLVFIGGTFTSLAPTGVTGGPFPRNRLASVSAGTTAAPTIWDPNLNDTALTITHAGGLVYAGGPFTTSRGSFARGGAAAWNPAGTGVPTSWNPQVLLGPSTPGSVSTLTPSASTMYIGGVFRTVGGVDSPMLAAVSLATGAANTTWRPAANDLVTWVALGPQGLSVAGVFTALGFPPPGGPFSTVEPAAAARGGFGQLRALPDAPTVTATPGDTTATVSFEPPAYTGGDTILGYTLTSNPGGITLTNVQSPTVVTGLGNGTGYTFSVTATTSAGTGPAGTATATPRTTPGAPTGVTGVPGDTQVTVNFTPPASNGGSPVLYYIVTASPGGQVATGPAGPIVVPGLANGTPYTFTVVASNSAGDGPASAPSAPVIPAEGGRKHPSAPDVGPRPPTPDVPPITTPRKPPPHSQP